MSRCEPVLKDKTTIVTSKLLLDRVSSHIREEKETLTDFITRALINQLEREGDMEVRALMEEENED